MWEKVPPSALVFITRHLILSGAFFVAFFPVKSGFFEHAYVLSYFILHHRLLCLLFHYGVYNGVQKGVWYQAFRRMKFVLWGRKKNDQLENQQLVFVVDFRYNMWYYNNNK